MTVGNCRYASAFENSIQSPLPLLNTSSYLYKNMGGHGEHGHGPPYKIPNADIYKIDDVPKLAQLRDRLAAKGLKDPWLRNEVWRYQLPGTPMKRVGMLLLKGSKVGIPAFLLTLGIEHALGIDYSHGHHGGHDSHDHH